MLTRTASILFSALFCALSLLPGHAQEKEGSLYTHRVQIDVEEKQVPGEAGAIGLKLGVSIKSLEHLVNYKELEMHAIVTGRYEGPKKRLAKRKERMVLNQSRPFDLKAGETFSFESALMESGRGNPDHPHFGVFYEGYLIVVKDKYGKIVASDSNFKPLTERYAEIKDIKEGEDFKTYTLVNR